MRDLAPEITRQRLIVEGHFSVAVDEEAIARFFVELTDALELRRYGEPTIFSPGGAGRAENQGYDAFVPLIDSGISLYVWTRARFLALVVFSCKVFDADHAVAVTRRRFAMTDLEHETF